MDLVNRDFEFLNFHNLSQILSRDVFVFGTGETCLEFLNFLNTCDQSISISSFIDSFKGGVFNFHGQLLPIEYPSYLESKDGNLIVATIYFLEVLANIPASFSGQIFVLSNELIHAASPLSRLGPFHIDVSEHYQVKQSFQQIKWGHPSKDMAALYLELRLGMQDKEFLTGWLELIKNSQVPNRISDLILGGKAEILLIGGVFDGSQIFELVNTLSSSLKIIGVDPDLSIVPSNMLQLLNKYSNVVLIESALSSHVGNLEFFSFSNSSSQVVQNVSAEADNIFQVATTTVDRLLEKSMARSVGIFLDIEGSERDAVLGMRKTCNEKLVSLEIASYHRNTDLIELPILINNLTNKDSEFFFKATNPTFIDSNILVSLF